MEDPQPYGNHCQSETTDSPFPQKKMAIEGWVTVVLAEIDLIDTE
jgi:hypothetical protein